MDESTTPVTRAELREELEKFREDFRNKDLREELEKFREDFRNKDLREELERFRNEDLRQELEVFSDKMSVEIARAMDYVTTTITTTIGAQIADLRAEIASSALANAEQSRREMAVVDD